MSRSYITDGIQGSEKQHGFCMGEVVSQKPPKNFERISEHVDVGDLLDIVYLAFLKAFGKGCLMKGSYKNWADIGLGGSFLWVNE